MYYITVFVQGSGAVVCYITKSKKELLGASVSHAHGEALLCATSTISIVTMEVALKEA